jgi:hypothetical protein
MSIYSEFFNNWEHSNSDEWFEHSVYAIQAASIFIKKSNGYIPTWLLRKPTSLQLSILYSFQFGVCLEACRLINLKPPVTLIVAKNVFQVVNEDTSDEIAKEMVIKAMEYSSISYPPINHGMEAFNKYTYAQTTEYKEEALKALFYTLTIAKL